MDKTFDEDIALIRKAERGVEVREAIAQGMEYVEQFAGVASAKSQEAADSAAAAKQALTDTLTAKTEAVQAISDARTAALSDVAASTKTATNAANTAEEKAAAAAESETGAKIAATSANKSAQAALKDAENAEKFAAAAKASADKAAASVSTDKTLTIEGAPADAKAVGDALEGVMNADTVKALIADALAEDHAKIKFWISEDPTSPAALFGGSWEQIASERVLMGASSTHAAGSTVEAGLPNIIGSLTETKSDGGSSPFRGNKNAITSIGALEVTEIASNYAGYSSYSGSAYDISFNASRSNSIYGASTTVQPAAYYVHIWHRVA